MAPQMTPGPDKCEMPLLSLIEHMTGIRIAAAKVGALHAGAIQRSRPDLNIIQAKAKAQGSGSTQLIKCAAHCEGLDKQLRFSLGKVCLEVGFLVDEAAQVGVLMRVPHRVPPQHEGALCLEGLATLIRDPKDHHFCLAWGQIHSHSRAPAKQIQSRTQLVHVARIVSEQGAVIGIKQRRDFCAIT